MSERLPHLENNDETSGQNHVEAGPSPKVEPARMNLDNLFEPRERKPLGELPGLLRSAVALVWKAGRRNTEYVLAITIVQSLVTVAQLLLIRRLLGGLAEVSNGARVGTLAPALIAFVGIYTAQSVMGLADGLVRQVLGEEVARHATSLVAKVASSADLLDFERPEFHDRLQRSLANASVRPLQTAFALISIVSALLTSIAVAVTLAAIQPLLLVLLLVAFGPMWIVTRRLTKLGFAWTVAESAMDRRRNYLLYLLTNKEQAKEVRAYQLADELDRRHGELWDARLGRLRVVTRRRMALGLVGRLVNGAMLGLVLGILAWMVSTGRSSVSQAGVAAGAVILLGQRIGSLLGSVGQLYECSLFLHDVDSFLVQQRVADEARPTGLLGEPLSVLTASDVRFTYPAGRGEALAGVSLEVRPGEMVALVGVNGSGKTTMAKVLAGLLPASDGMVRWNDRDLADVDPGLWRSEVAVVFQDFARYLMTLAENVGFGRVSRLADLDGLAAAAIAGGIDELITTLPNGWQTQLGPEFIGGSDLSGGQWQRIALARAFFRDAPVLILDEPSSALDPEAEAALFDRVKELCEGRAVIVISHRFSTVTRADRIYVMAEGRVIENGSHASLLEADGTYARLFRLQADPYGV